ncbi:hypothetical protein HIM_06141 [Hirsutella minnesotensis 3608]|uniref:AMP-dependent synthetase/ligase domain-containing protein n=1 Tax=Hirsutella minnesotensis 3608 TaxID=1043627 RepID=A0A0F7ZNY2_9HYPO|nr:hypothetical protein HIM_06141 [Hirsutella minnesotensis 3608]
MTAGETLQLPNDPILTALLRAAQRASASDIFIHDVLGFDKTYEQLLGDVSRTRHVLLSRLPPLSTDDRGILCADVRNIAVLTRSAYEILVAFFSCRAIGAVFVPLASGVFPEEAQYILSKAKATLLLVGRERVDKAEAIRAHIDEHDKSPGSLTLLPISCDASPLSIAHACIDEAAQVDPNGPGLIMFTSGTTGRLKGVVLPRRCYAEAVLAELGSVTISHRPAIWVGGLRDIIVPAVTGIKLFALGEMASAAQVLHAFAQHRITHAAFSPPILRQMKDLLTSRCGEISEEERAKWHGRFKPLGAIRCSASVLEPSAIQFWTHLTGLPFENMYGATELGCIAIRGTQTMQGSIGVPTPGVKVKLSEGSKGEISIKCPTMFLRYLDDEDLTSAALDENGYFKTGDLAELKDGEYLFRGRAISDFILCHILRIPIVDVESSLMDLPYIAEACVIGVPNYTTIQLCGALVRLKKHTQQQITLARIRSDLSASLPLYMLPCVLRLLKEGEHLPRTHSGKLIKKDILKEYFGNADGLPTSGVSPDINVEQCAWPNLVWEGSKPWDGGGLQRDT